MEVTPLHRDVPGLRASTVEERIAAYEASVNDADAASCLRVEPEAFAEWRRAVGLPPKSPLTSPRLDREEDLRRLDAYHETLRDAHAARVLGISHHAFAMWRAHRGLPAKSPLRRVEGDEEQRRRAAYAASGSDGEAARSLDIELATFGAWRRGRGLPAKRAQKVRGIELPERERERRRAAYAATRNDREAAASLGLKGVTFGAWRKREGLPAKHERALASAQESRRVDAYRAHATDAEAALALGMDRSQFSAWRRKRGFPTKHETPRLSSEEEARRRDALASHATDAEAARFLGISKDAFTKWRHDRKFPPASGRTVRHARGPRERTPIVLRKLLVPVSWASELAERLTFLGERSHTRAPWSREEDERRFSTYRSEIGDSSAARALGIHTIEFVKWREARRLPRKLLPRLEAELARRARAEASKPPPRAPRTRASPEDVRLAVREAANFASRILGRDA